MQKLSEFYYYVVESTLQKSMLITRQYPTDRKVSDRDMQTLNLDQYAILPIWNYTIAPREIGINFCTDP